MSFTVQLTPDYIPVEPGATTPVSVVVVSKSDRPDRFELEIEGVDPEWTAVPVPVFNVEPDETHSEKIFFKPNRTSESLAGNYPFVVRVRSLESGEAKTVQAILQVKPFNHITMEINPKKGFYSVWSKRNDFAVSVVNLGNTEHTVQLIGNDPEDSCAYEFETDQVTVGPGHQKDVEFEAVPTTKSIFAAGRLIGFSVTGRSKDSPSVVTTSQAQIEQRPLLSATGLIGLVIAAVVIGLWLLMMPKAVEITSFSVSPQMVQKGQTVTVSWSTSQAASVKVIAGSDVIQDGPQLNGSVDYTLTQSGDVLFQISASKDGRVKREDLHLSVKEPPSTPEPEVLSLQAKPKSVKLGAKFELDYSLNDAVVKAVLEPINMTLDPTLTRIDITPDSAGDIQYTVVASNKDGKTTSKSVSVNVFEESDATIIAFTPSLARVAASVGRITLSWQVSGSVRVELSSNTGLTLTVDPSGSQDVPVLAKTTFTLTAYDAKGRKTSQSRTIDVIPDLPPPDQNGPDGKTAGGATGATTTGNTTTSTTAGGNR